MTEPANYNEVDITRITLPNGEEVSYDDMTPDDRQAIDLINSGRRKIEALSQEIERETSIIETSFRFLQLTAPVNYMPIESDEQEAIDVLDATDVKEQTNDE